MSMARQVRRAQEREREKTGEAPVVYSELVIRFKTLKPESEMTEAELAGTLKVHRGVTCGLLGPLIHVRESADRTSYFYNWSDVRSVEAVESRIDQATPGLVQ